MVEDVAHVLHAVAEVVLVARELAAFGVGKQFFEDVHGVAPRQVVFGLALGDDPVVVPSGVGAAVENEIVVGG